MNKRGKKAFKKDMTKTFFNRRKTEINKIEKGKSKEVYYIIKDEQRRVGEAAWKGKWVRRSRGKVKDAIKDSCHADLVLHYS